MVLPKKGLVVVRDSQGVPYDFEVGHSTRIVAGNEPLKLADLASRTSSSVSIRFIPERKGDVAESIKLAQ